MVRHASTWQCTVPTYISTGIPSNGFRISELIRTAGGRAHFVHFTASIRSCESSSRPMPTVMTRRSLPERGFSLSCENRYPGPRKQRALQHEFGERIDVRVKPVR